MTEYWAMFKVSSSSGS